MLLDATKWRTEKNRASSIERKTYSNFDEGPIEYQTVQNSIKHGKELKTRLENIINSIESVKQKVPILKEKIRDLVSVVYDNKEGDADDLKDEIISLSREIYKANFSRGFDIEPFSAGAILLWSLFGLMAGGGMGLGLD